MERHLLQRLGLLQPPRTEGARGASLLALCGTGALVGGLSVAPDVQPDELLGPLCAALGGRMRRLKVLDVRATPREEILFSLDGVEGAWPGRGITGLLDEVNRFFEACDDVGAAVLLGEWEEMLQLWCVSKALLPELLGSAGFACENRRWLERCAARRSP